MKPKFSPPSKGGISVLKVIFFFPLLPLGAIVGGVVDFFLCKRGGEAEASCPLQPQSKKKPHQIFRQAFFSLAENPSFLASPPLLQRKKSTKHFYYVFHEF